MCAAAEGLFGYAPEMQVVSAEARARNTDVRTPSSETPKHSLTPSAVEELTWRHREHSLQYTARCSTAGSCKCASCDNRVSVDGVLLPGKLARHWAERIELHG